MSEGPTRRFFIPPWLDDIDLKPHPFRVFCHLLRRAGEDGRCYPSAPSIAAACRISKDTVWPALNALEEAKLIERLPKKFGGSNTYLIKSPIGGNSGVIDEAIGGNSGSVKSLQSAEKAGRQSAENMGCQSAEKEGRKEIPLKKSNLKKSNRENSSEEIQFAVWFKSSLPQDQQDRLPSNWLNQWCEIHEKLVRLDNRTPEQIREVCQWARTDSFWTVNFRSPSKLRERDKQGTLWFDFFTGKMTQPTGSNQKPATKVNTGGRNAGTTSMEITDDEF